MRFRGRDAESPGRSDGAGLVAWEGSVFFAIATQPRASRAGAPFDRAPTRQGMNAMT